MRGKLYPHADKWACGLFVAIACIALALSSGCVSAPAIEHARRARAANTGIAAKVDLPDDVRGVAEDNEDAWSAMLYLLNGDRLPVSTEARLRLRGQLPEGYGK